ncbi:glycosyltransferase [Kutzneria kofuensis]|uniref:Cellulose synthase/poly-beta-1,6-N-acetylglucosamine synthase-like glycosyltransferase n=1 Tax=Kutzneria kofuensis TaxID=103725 RepID=A0A7W9KNQ1_9PSEU|nr:glycosyltransferase family 2 protein [Kutzneria kofuensis]MBB5895921.1 cellulose synthase/poly-beta-1,6-N-acetylglucosamine synthase-like glycosyltransferase [Kutzneria kofuensis]
MIRWAGLVLLALNVALIAVLVVHALRRRFDDSDRGVGNVVRLPKPHPPSLRRVAAFVVICLGGSVVLNSARSPDLSTSYRWAIGRAVTSVVPLPGVVADYVSHLRPVIPISFLAFTVALALCVRASPLRRLLILLHAPLAIFASLTADTALGVIGLEFRLPLGPFPLVSILMHYAVAYVMAMRLALTTYLLPRPTQVPIRRTGDTFDTVLTIVSLAAVSVFVAAGAAYVVSLIGDDPVAYTFLLLAIPVYLKFGLYIMLSVLRVVGRRRLPMPGPNPPPIDVIGPAFNEETNIVRWVQSVDRAAAAYGGPVHLILCDDGSTDDTRRLAEEAMARATALQGTVIAGSHTGKATALNLALTRCTADYVVRHDTDCELHPNVFRYSVPWFQADPRIGLVGAFMLPKFPFRTWVDRMRSLELAAGFGLPRLAYAVVDMQPCVPGNYTAVRRTAALEVGGWPEGMLGEDIDFTCSLARIGYRAVYDRRVWAYEDVPESLAQLRLQRRRWSQGSIYNFARFVPFAAGSAGPRFWFAEFFKGARRLVQPMQFAAYLFALQAAVLQPDNRQNLFHLLAFFVLAKLPMLLVTICALFYRRLWKSLLWWPLFLGFVIVKRLANVEALLLLRTRPVRPVWRPARRVAPNPDITWPVLAPRYLTNGDA